MAIVRIAAPTEPVSASLKLAVVVDFRCFTPSVTACGGDSSLSEGA
ncbi:hypothetical protein [Flintibacter muris]|nr:hypothetical protein [Flintibacter muris]